MCGPTFHLLQAITDNLQDLDGDGGITVEEYAKEIKATEEELKKMIKDLDKNGDDKMDFEGASYTKPAKGGFLFWLTS
jgi:hypothetical protein